jgi:hypothetical protein
VLIERGPSRWIGVTLTFSLAALLGGAGCGGGGDRLVIATDLTETECRALEEHGGEGPAPRWAHLRTGESASRLAEAGAAIDLVIVATADEGRRLAARGVIEKETVRAIRRPPAGLAIARGVVAARALPEPSGLADIDRPEYRALIAWSDPATDAAALAVSRHALGEENGKNNESGWLAGYARLVRLAGGSGPMAPGRSNALAALGRGEGAVAPAFGPEAEAAGLGLGFVAIGPARDAIAGVARGSPRMERARAWLGRVGHAIELDGDRRERPGAALEVALLSAVLTTAQPELWGASAALAALPEGGRRDELAAFMVEPPPWPPSSVSRLRSRDPSGALVDELAGQVATGLEARTWLLESWERPERPIDGLFLDELGRAADGLLAEGPRFRAWVAAEWSTWARQRFRRVAREAERAKALAAAPSSSSGGEVQP